MVRLALEKVQKDKQLQSKRRVAGCCGGPGGGWRVAGYYGGPRGGWQVRVVVRVAGWRTAVLSISIRY